MRIVVFGATGPTGRRLTEQALDAGHQVTAVARRAGSLPQQAGLTAVAADVGDADAVAGAVAGGDAVLSALGVPPSRKPVGVYSTGARTIVAAMERHGVKRLLVVSSSVLDPAWRPSGAFFFNRVLDPYVNRVIAGTAHADMRRMEALLRSCRLEWTVVRPSGLFDHPGVTDFQVAPDSADGVFTSRGDLAAAMLRELGQGRFVGRAMGVVTTAVRPGIPRLVWNEAVRKKH